MSVGLRRLRRTLLAGGTVALVAAVAAGASWADGWVSPVVALVLLVGVSAAGWWLIGRNWASWGYAERGNDLLIRHGVMFKSMVVVPYDRMQFADISAGPLDRRFGIARVRLHTASPATDAVIPGLARAEARALRDRLAVLGDARAAGL